MTDTSQSMEAPEGQNPVLAALLSNTQTMTTLQATMQAIQNDLSTSKTLDRELANTLLAKLDNLDRSMSEVRLATEKSEEQRHGELHRIFTLLGEERKDRREAIADGVEGERLAAQSEKELLRELIREEMGSRKETKNLAVEAGKAVWEAGGRWIVAALAFLVVAAVSKATGISVMDVLGLNLQVK